MHWRIFFLRHAKNVKKLNIPLEKTEIRGNLDNVNGINLTHQLESIYVRHIDPKPAQRLYELATPC